MASDSCYATATARQFRDNEFTKYSAEPVFAGSIGAGCDLVELKGLPLGLRMTFGVYGEIMETAPITIQSAFTGDPLVKRLGTMGFVGGTGELHLPTFGAFTPSILLRYGVDVGTIVLPRGSFTDATGWAHSFAKRRTNQMGIGGCLDYRKSLKVCAEYARLTYDTYPHSWFDAAGREQGKPEPITAANEFVGRIVVPFSSFKM